MAQLAFSMTDALYQFFRIREPRHIQAPGVKRVQAWGAWALDFMRSGDVHERARVGHISAQQLLSSFL